MKIITESKLFEMLLKHKGATLVGLVTATSPVMLKKNRETKELNPFQGKSLVRTAQRHGMLGASYENAVNNRREAEGHPQAGEFKAESLWNGAGEYVEQGCKTLVRHRATGKTYVVFYPHRDDSVIQDTWTIDGAEVQAEALAPYLPLPSEGSKRQETLAPVPWRIIGLDSIVQLVMNGETYMIAR